MDNYEINILRRSGNWNKVKPDDPTVETFSDDKSKKNKNDQSKKNNIVNKNIDHQYLLYINEINSIINKLETLEHEKNFLKNELKTYENEFLLKKKNAEDIISKVTEEKVMIEKTIKVIKNLKSL